MYIMYNFIIINMMLTKSQKRNLRKKQNKRTVNGKGAYNMTDLGNDLKNVAKTAVRTALTEGGGALGSVVASRLGMNASAGGGVGRTLGAKLSRIIGSGDYVIGNEVAVNALINGSRTGDVNASFASTNDVVRVRHREYIQDVVSGSVAGAFTNLGLAVNPGLAGLFPYLASIAQNFEEYKFNGLVFEFVSTTSPYNSSSAMGSVIMAMEYNPLAPPFTNKQSMENSDFAVSTRFDKNMMYGVECKQFTQNAYLVRYQTATPLTAYDTGLFQVAVQPASTFPTNSVLGELWVSYDVTLSRPRISPARYGFSHGMFTGTGSTGDWIASTNTLVSSFGTLSSTAYTNAPRPTVTIKDIIQGDVYCLTVMGYHTATAGGYGFNIALTNLTAFNIVNQHNQCFNIPTSASGSSNTCGVWYLQATGVTGSTATISLATTGAPTSGTFTIDFVITDIGNGYDVATL